MRQRLLIGILVLVWFGIAAWQIFEHQRVMELSRKSLARRAHDLSAALSVVIRSQGRIAVVPKPRLEIALAELVRSTELESVMLLNESGEITAAAGKPLAIPPSILLRTHQYWTRDAASFANLVALGPGAEGNIGMAAILPLDIPPRGARGESPAAWDDARWLEEFLSSPPYDDILDDRKRGALIALTDGQPLDGAQIETILEMFQEGNIEGHREETLKRLLLGRPLDRETLEDLMLLLFFPRRHAGRGPENEPWLRDGGSARHGPPPDRPPWMGREEYERLVQERGVHWFLVTIPTEILRSEMARDMRLRGIVLAVALFACLAMALAWRSIERTGKMAIQLVQARETANHLQVLNITAAGLVHETKNPLNLIRGSAQMISREKELPDALRKTAVSITEEADRVAGRLNQFLDYARPLQPRPRVLLLNELVENIFAVLKYDQEEKLIVFSLTGPQLTVTADEDMLRQVLFNLILNAVQAVSDGGHVEVSLHRESDRLVGIDIGDDGPGVPEEKRKEIFRPYVTTSKDGTGLGLAVVHQIALAHHWQVTCLPVALGAKFHISGIEGTQDEETGNKQ